MKESIPTTISYVDYIHRAHKSRNLISTAAETCGAKTLDPTKVLCPKNECKSLQNGRPLYRDADHMSENGNKILTPMFKDALNP